MVFGVAHFIDLYRVDGYGLPVTAGLTHFYGKVVKCLDPFSCRISNNFGIYAGNSRAQCKNC